MTVLLGPQGLEDTPGKLKAERQAAQDFINNNAFFNLTILHFA